MLGTNSDELPVKTHTKVTDAPESKEVHWEKSKIWIEQEVCRARQQKHFTKEKLIILL